jgi:hypothetical protein
MTTLSALHLATRSLTGAVHFLRRSKSLASILPSLLLTGLMTLVMTAVMRLMWAGFSSGFFGSWMETWITAWPIAFPVAYLAGPPIRKLAARITAPALQTVVREPGGAHHSAPRAAATNDFEVRRELTGDCNA